MNIFSSHAADTRSSDSTIGGYEWWYFDALSADGTYSLVVIFYEGNPFSLTYNDAREGRLDLEALPSNFPAVSISIYENGSPIYYSFTEFKADQCTFDEDEPYVAVGNHRMETNHTDQSLRYKLTLAEKLPNGDSLHAELTFTSRAAAVDFAVDSMQQSTAHRWNLVQPRADVNGNITIKSEAIANRVIDFKGSGYHDHNTGSEPMRNEFDNWYWGRFHFHYATLVYYIMNRSGEQQQRAWLIGRDKNNIIGQFDDITVSDKSPSLFGLSSARKLNFRSEKINIQVQQAQKMDNGPFYQRFLSDGFLEVKQEGILESQQGITEYIRPDRIDTRLFRPLVNMRIRQDYRKPHWVQRSSRLYRWTW